MTALIQGKWPSLKALALASNSSMNASAQLHSSAKQRAGLLWANISPTHVKLDSCTCSLALLYNRLNNINLAFADVDAAALSQLTALPWPQLDLIGSRLTADAMASLVSTMIYQM